MSSGPRRRTSSAARISQPTRTSSSGGAVSETRRVSPIPSDSRMPRPTDDLMVPESDVPASVTPMWSGYGTSRASRRYASTVGSTEDALAETTMSSNPREETCSQKLTALAASFSGSGMSASRYSRARLPAFTPMRTGMPASPAASMTASTRAMSPMLPGLIRSLAAPRRAASMASRWSKWMSATTGSGLAAHTSANPWSASACGIATRTISHPASARRSICESVACGSRVSVFVMDCTATGAPSPIRTPPTLTPLV